MAKFAVILVIHNESRFLINWLSKMTAQFKGEIIVVDNASTDNSVELIKAIYPDLRILKLTVNTGPFGGFIAGAKATESEYVACYSPDDEILPDYISKMEEAIVKYPLVDLYTCNTEVIREGIRYERILLPYTAYISPDYAVKMCQSGYNKNFNLCGLVVKRDVVLKMWEEGGKYIDVNFDCLFSFYTIFDKGFVNVGEKLFVYNSYPASWGAARNREKIWEAIKSQLSIYSNYPHIYKRAIESKVFSTERHLISGLAVKYIMKFPLWIRKLLYKKIYKYDWRAEKLC